MSYTVKSYGFVAVLVDPVPKDARDDLSELLYDSKSKLQINNEGTLVYMDFNLHESSEVRADIYALTIGSTTASGRAKFLEALSHVGLSIKTETIQPYEEIWYNGSDSVLSCLTKDHYLNTLYLSN